MGHFRGFESGPLILQTFGDGMESLSCSIAFLRASRTPFSIVLFSGMYVPAGAFVSKLLETKM